MKLLVDSSSSLLFSLLLAQLPILTSALPVHHRRIPDLEKLTNQTRNLLKLTQDLLKDHVIDTDIEHRFKSLPAMTNRASDLSTLELKSTLSQLLVDLQSFEVHFDWLNRASRKHKQAALPKLGEMISHIKSLSASLLRQIQKVDAPRLPSPTPSLPPLPAFQWDVVQSSLELLQQFRLFCDWASRALLTLKSKI
ncbi:interleukin-11 [Megalops cyprinoides]|uniref:interleukin-11 n=1 Tax=Megalops cyprinoides TaxID=118141 RepID=UPI0018640AF6|nr:interleukin-11 [Megalops cyprinoides]